MSEHVYKVVEVIGCSPNSWEEAAKLAIKSAGGSIEDLRVAQVVDQDIRIEKDDVVAFRTRLNLSFRIHEKSELQK
jgi:flavin-binding protein dodecin